MDVGMKVLATLYDCLIYSLGPPVMVPLTRSINPYLSTLNGRLIGRIDGVNDSLNKYKDETGIIEKSRGRSENRFSLSLSQGKNLWLVHETVGNTIKFRGNLPS
ncbi:hypothetical protein QLL95_gp1130 [Cotonvirus japonicus]|uniref:Uncharacterized protein n=1 Tax=Cotonvirus japonicus TaxID=2811091 RepID=A0ABM7NS60_9VIRU|nr:hypothetical protein QLL95_gp1130 [Cotonvirus japonicus]BCS82993.1 hypothetical protein [Cotonvirus japonicus]